MIHRKLKIYCGPRFGHLPKHIHKDTIFLSNVQYDSIYVLQDKYTDRSKDTLLIKESNIEYRYKLHHDTIRVIQRDSIPYEDRITEVKEVKYTPPWIQYFAWAGGVSILLLICCAICKFSRK